MYTRTSNKYVKFHIKNFKWLLKKWKQENPSVARKPRDAAAVLFSLKFADDIHYKFKIVAKLRNPGFRAPNIPVQNRI